MALGQFAFYEDSGNVVMVYDPDQFEYTINPATDQIEVVGRWAS